MTFGVQILPAIGVGVSFVALILLCVGRKYRERNEQEAPGPMSLPLIGNLIQALGKDGFPAICLRLQETYGNVFRLWLGQMKVYVITGNKLIHEMLVENQKTYMQRPNWLFIPDKVFHRKGIIWTGGDEWDKLQSLILKTVHNNDRQTRIHEEIIKEFQVVSGQFEAANGKPIYPEDQFWKASFNVVSSFIFGSRFDHGDAEFQKLLDTVQFVAVNSKTQNPEHLFPWTVNFTKSKVNKLKQQNEEINKFLRSQFEIHQQRGESHQDKDFMDVFLSLSEEERSDLAYSEESIFKTIVDMYHGSMESVSGLLLWSVVYMCKYPDIQKKCQEELDQVLKENVFTLDKRSEIPFTQATANEIRRICGVVPFSALHTNDSDVIVDGYRIPRQSIILFHLQSACMDRQKWEKQEEFRPDRFLEPTDDESFPAFKPFGYGPRSCKGADLAIDIHLAFLANLLHRFQIAPSDKPPTLEGSYTGVTYRPKKFQVKFILRRNT